MNGQLSTSTALNMAAAASYATANVGGGNMVKHEPKDLGPMVTCGASMALSQIRPLPLFVVGAQNPASQIPQFRPMDMHQGQMPIQFPQQLLPQQPMSLMAPQQQQQQTADQQQQQQHHHQQQQHMNTAQTQAMLQSAELTDEAPPPPPKKKKKKRANQSPSMVPSNSATSNLEDVKLPQMPYNTSCTDSDLEAFLAYQRLCSSHLDLKTKLSQLYNSKQTCQVCQKEFDGFSKLRRHLQSHTDFRPYRCENCSKSFANLSKLKRHSTTHSGSKPYQCAMCETSVSRREHLKRHMLTHSEMKPYKCNQCDHSARRLDSMNHHIRQRHMDGAQIMYLSPETCQFEVKSIVPAVQRNPDGSLPPKPKKKKYKKKKKEKTETAEEAAKNASMTGQMAIPTSNVDAAHAANHPLIEKWDQGYLAQIFGQGGQTGLSGLPATAASIAGKDGQPAPKKKKKKKKKKADQNIGGTLSTGAPTSSVSPTTQPYTIPNVHGGSLYGQTGQFLPVGSVVTSSGNVPTSQHGALETGPAGGSSLLQQQQQQMGKSNRNNSTSSVESQGNMHNINQSPAGSNTQLIQSQAQGQLQAGAIIGLHQLADKEGAASQEPHSGQASGGYTIPAPQGTPPVSITTPTPEAATTQSGAGGTDAQFSASHSSPDDAPDAVKKEGILPAGAQRFVTTTSLPQDVANNFSGLPSHLYQPQQCYPQGAQFPGADPVPVTLSMANNLPTQSSGSAFQTIYTGGVPYDGAGQQQQQQGLVMDANYDNPSFNPGPAGATTPSGQIPEFFRKRISQGCRQLNEMASFHLRSKESNMQ